MLTSTKKIFTRREVRLHVPRLCLGHAPRGDSLLLPERGLELTLTRVYYFARSEVMWSQL